MNSNNFFSLKRFGLLCRYNLIHTYKRVLLSLFTGVGIFFIFLLFKSYLSSPFMSRGHDHLAIFFVIFGLTIFGTAFPAFRTREKTQVFIMIPASAPEKFLFEIINRIILLFLIIPIFFWLTYLMEGHFYEAISNFPFTPVAPFEGWPKIVEKFGYIFVPSIIMLILVIPFMGASIFMRNPIGKTLFFLVVIIVFHFFMVFLPGKYFKLRSFDGDPFWIKDGKDAATFFSIYFIILTIGFLSVTYYKLKEREV